MKILFFIARLQVRGSSRRVIELSNHLARMGHDVTICTADGEPPADWLPVEVPVITLADVAAIPDAAILCGNWQDGGAFVLAFPSPCYRAAYVLGIGSDREVARAEMANNSFLGRMVRAGVHLLANCTPIAGFFREQGLACEAVIGGVDPDMFYPRPVGFVDSHRIVGVGSKRAIEGTQEIMDAVMMARRAEPGLYWEFYAGLNHSQERIAGLYSSSLCLLDASHHGGWCNPVAEAMACGCPVICTDIDGTRDLADNKTAIVVQPGDVPAMADAIVTMRQNAKLRQYLRANALARIAPYTWEAAAWRLEAVLSQETGAGSGAEVMAGGTAE